MSRFVTTCRGSTCHAQVLMTDEITGKRHPFDWPITTCDLCNGKGEIVVTKPATLFDAEHQEREKCKPCKGTGYRPISHYRTCPNANEFRQPKEARVHD